MLISTFEVCLLCLNLTHLVRETKRSPKDLKEFEIPLYGLQVAEQL